MWRRVVLLAGALVLTGCGGTDAGAPPAPAVDSTTIDTGQVIAPAPASSTTTTPALRANALGTEIRTALGNTVTVYAYEPLPMERSFPTPSAGNGYAAVEVGGCVSTGSEGPDPQYFDLVLPDWSRLRPTFALKQPALRATRLAVGECIRGWITFEVPTSTRPQAVVFNASSLVRWAIP